MNLSKLEADLMEKDWVWWNYFLIALGAFMISIGLLLEIFYEPFDFLVQSGIILFTLSFSLSIITIQLFPNIFGTRDR